MTAAIPAPLRALLDLPDEQRCIGAFRLIRQLGRGGFAPVWLAAEVFEGVTMRTVAIKLFSPGSADEHDAAATRVRERREAIFEEARALCRVSHPNVVRFYSVAIDEARGVIGLVMEHVTGKSVEEELAAARAKGARGLPMEKVVAIGIAVAASLSVVHRARIVHRDIKPSNVLDAAGVYKVIDFGVAAAQAAATPEPRPSRPREIIVAGVPIAVGTKMSTLLDDDDALGRDLPAMATGTVGYVDPALMAARATTPTPASDLYSLGVTLFECVVGRLPSVDPRELGTMRSEILIGQERAPKVASHAPELPLALAQLVDALLDPDPAKRPTSAEEVERALDAVRVELLAPARAKVAFDEADVLEAGRNRIAPWKLVVAALAAIALVAGFVVLQRWRSERSTRRVNAAWSDFAQCMIGPPLSKDESIATRMRRIVVADRAAGGAGSWPMACAGHADELHKVLMDEGRRSVGEQDLALRTETLSGLLRAPPTDIDQNFYEVLAGLWDEARTEGLVLVASEVSAPPLSTTLTLDALEATPRLGAPPFRFLPVTEAEQLIVESEGRLCVVDANGEGLRCEKERNVGASVFGRPDVDAAPLFVRDGAFLRGDDGRALAFDDQHLFPIDAFTRTDGVVTLLCSRDAPGFSLVRAERGKPAVVSEPKELAKVSSAHLYGDVLLVGAPGETDGYDLDAYRVTTDGSLSASTRLGHWDDAYGPSDVHVCRAKNTTALWVVGTRKLVMISQGDAWLPAMPAQSAAEASLSCAQGEATLLSYRRDADDMLMITREKCSASGCTLAEVRGPRIRLDEYAVADAGDRLVVAFQSPLGIRVRSAPPEDFAGAIDRIVLDDQIAKGKLTQGVSLGLDLLSRPGLVMLMLTTSDGVWARRVLADGELAPVLMREGAR